MTYRRRPTPLHAARAWAGSAYCLALAALALVLEHPVALLALLAAVLAAAAGAQAGRAVRRALLWAAPFAVLIALVNALVTREGLTVLARLGELPPLGRIDVTLEATAYGAVLGLRALVVIACFALHSAAVDPDELLRGFRRVGLRSALTASLATRLVPVLARDARRVHDAQRCRVVGGASRAGVVRAVAAGALDRAVDVAATLEVRGFGSGHRAAAVRRQWSRHDVAFTVAAVALAALAVLAAAGADPFVAYPRTAAPVDAGVLVLAGSALVLALAPFADRRGVAG